MVAPLYAVRSCVRGEMSQLVSYRAVCALASDIRYSRLNRLRFDVIGSRLSL